MEKQLSSRNRTRLTEAIVAALKPTGRDYTIFDAQPGFCIRVTPTGTKIFIARKRVRERRPRVTIGFSPAMTVAEAREEALHTWRPCGQVRTL